MRYKTKTKKSGYQQYLVTVTDTTEAKPTVTVQLDKCGDWKWCQWQVGHPVMIGEKLSYDTCDCPGHRSKKDAIWWLQRDGVHIDENTITDSIQEENKMNQEENKMKEQIKKSQNDLTNIIKLLKHDDILAIYAEENDNFFEQRQTMIISMSYGVQSKPLDFDRLFKELDSDDYETQFTAVVGAVHDINGFVENVNRETYEIENGWTPRYGVKQ